MMSDRYHFNFGDVPDETFDILEWYDQYEDMRLLLQRVRRSYEQDKNVSLTSESFTLLLSAIERYSLEVGTGSTEDVWVALQDMTRGTHPELYEEIQETWSEVWDNA